MLISSLSCYLSSKPLVMVVNELGLRILELIRGTGSRKAIVAALASDVQSGERPVSVDPTAHREKAIPRLMFLSRVTVALVVTTLAISTAFVACAGKDGATGQDGAIGPTGPQGTPGAPGVEGKPGSVGDAGTLSGACTTPCHTFNGVVDQWRFSNHSHPQNNEIGGGSCGNCHALDGIELGTDE